MPPERIEITRLPPIEIHDDFVSKQTKEIFKIAEFCVLTITGFSFVYSQNQSSLLLASFVLLASIIVYSVAGIYLFKDAIVGIGGSIALQKKILWWSPTFDDFISWLPRAYLLYGFAIILFVLGLFIKDPISLFFNLIRPLFGK